MIGVSVMNLGSDCDHHLSGYHRTVNLWTADRFELTLPTSELVEVAVSSHLLIYTDPTHLTVLC